MNPFVAKTEEGLGKLGAAVWWASGRMGTETWKSHQESRQFSGTRSGLQKMESTRADIARVLAKYSLSEWLGHDAMALGFS